MSWFDFATLISGAVGWFYLIRHMLREVERRLYVVRIAAHRGSSAVSRDQLPRPAREEPPIRVQEAAMVRSPSIVAALACSVLVGHGVRGFRRFR